MRVWFFIVLLLTSLSSLAHAEEVDLELVLAMDASGSISEAEYILQLKGTSEAFKDPEIQAAITSGPTGRIAVAVVLWSDAAFPKIASNWFLLNDARSSEAFGQFVRRFQLTDKDAMDIGGGGGTGIGSGVQEAMKMLNTNQYIGLRRVIDVSGDGIETEFEFSKGPMIRDAKVLANAQNITINGLAIAGTHFPDLDEYYRKEVIVGAGSFAIKAEGFEDFGRAIREKLLREISSKIAGLQHEQNTQIADLKHH